MPEPEITVIIPTRERCDVLAACLRSVTSQRYGNLKILVSDNASTDETRAVVAAARDPRIQYVNTGKRVSMSHNWEFALSSVNSGWVTFIGDDDGFPADAILNAGRIIQETGVSAVRSRPCTYNWPNDGWAKFGHLIAPIGDRVQIRDARDWLARVLSGRATYPNLPLIYNGGFVDMKVLKTIKKKTGSFFSSCTPDVYSAVAIASVITCYAFTDLPLAISGISRHSSGTSSFSTSKTTPLGPRQLFASEGNIPLHPEIPLTDDGGYPISLHALMYEAYLQSAALRPSAPAQHERQLPIILATAGAHRISVEAWGRRFAALHNLDYDAALARAGRIRLGMRARLGLAKLIHAYRSRSAGSADTPLLDVADAGAAVALLRHPPRPFSTLRREIARIRYDRR